MRAATYLGAYGLIVQGEAVLLIRKGRGPYTGSYDLPGGGIAFGESPLAALHREVREETGLHGLDAVLIDALSHRVRYQDGSGAWIDLHHLGFLYQVTVAAGAIPRADGDGEDALGAVWLPLRELDPAGLSPFARAALGYMQRKERT